MPGTPQKICIVCGKDVSGQPRWKDREGKYHCETCRSDYKIKTNLITGKQIVHYTCSHCKCALESPLEEAGQTFKCATCGKDVVTPGLADVIPLRATMEQQQRSRDEERHRREIAEVRTPRDSTDDPVTLAACPICESYFSLADLNKGGVCLDCAVTTAGRGGDGAVKPAHKTEPAVERKLTCHVCGGHFAVKDVYNQDGKVVCRPCCEEQAAAERETLGCPTCGGVFVISQMHPSGVCKQCASRPAPRRMPSNPAPLKSLLPVPENRSSGLPMLGCLMLALVGAFGAYYAYYAVSSWQGAQQTVVAKSDAPSAKTPQVEAAEAEAPVELQKLEGDIWLKTDGGDVRSIVLEDIYLLPNRLPTDDVRSWVLDLIDSLQRTAQGIRQVMGNDPDAPNKDSELHVADNLERGAQHLQELLHSDSISTSDLFVGICLYRSYNVFLVASRNALLNTRDEPSEMEYDPDFSWPKLIKNAISATETDRSGHFTLQNIAAGRYVLLCRTWEKASNAIVYWGDPIDISSATAGKIDLTNDNGQIMSY